MLREIIKNILYMLVGCYVWKSKLWKDIIFFYEWINICIKLILFDIYFMEWKSKMIVIYWNWIF